MVKIISLFKRDYEGTRLVYDELVPGAEWVANGEGRPTHKWDGTSCMVREDGLLYKRYDAKHGKTPPEDFVPAIPEPDPNTGHWPGWLAVGDGPEDKWFREAWAAECDHYECPFISGQTYELCGPKVQGNPEGLDSHVLIPHGKGTLVDCPREYSAFKSYFERVNIEGIVWHHADGRMVKIKAKDFGIRRRKIERREGEAG